MRNLIGLLATSVMLACCNGSVSQNTSVPSQQASQIDQGETGSMAANSARDPQRAVEEEFEKAKSQNTVEAWELFIARHPDNKLADDARKALAQLR